MLSNDILTALVQGAPDAMIVVDGTGTILFANRQVNALFGYAVEEIVGQKVECLVPEQLRGSHIGHRAGFMKSPTVRSMGTNLELAGCKKSGENFPIEISLSPLKTEKGLLAIAAIRDVSEKKQKEKKLIAANVALERFVYVASHDLQEPLRSLQQLILMLKDKIQDNVDEEGAYLVSRIMLSSSRMSLIIKDLLDFSRIGAKRELKSTDSNELLKEVLTSLGALIESTGAQIIVKKTLPTLDVCVVEFRLLLQNLIDNAIKFWFIRKIELRWGIPYTDD